MWIGLYGKSFYVSFLCKVMALVVVFLNVINLNGFHCVKPLIHFKADLFQASSVQDCKEEFSEPSFLYELCSIFVVYCYLTCRFLCVKLLNHCQGDSFSSTDCWTLSRADGDRRNVLYLSFVHALWPFSPVCYQIFWKLLIGFYLIILARTDLWLQ